MHTSLTETKNTLFWLPLGEWDPMDTPDIRAWSFPGIYAKWRAAHPALSWPYKLTAELLLGQQLSSRSPPCFKIVGFGRQVSNVCGQLQSCIL